MIAWTLSRPAWIAGALLGVCLTATGANATEFDFANITDLPGGPGGGDHPSINDSGDIAFMQGTRVYIYDQETSTFLDLQSLPGAPAEAWFPKLNRSGNVLMVNPTTREPWFFDARSQNFTNLSSLPGYPGVTQAHDLSSSFDFNNFNNASLHTGDLNFGDVYFYDHSNGSFLNITDIAGGRGRENRINDSGQIAYNGLPDVYVYDPQTGVTTNITDQPGGPGTSIGAFSLNVAGDVAVYSGAEISVYDSNTGTFLYLSTILGFPTSVASTNVNDFSVLGGISFWSGEIYYFDPIAQTFTQLTNQGIVPFPGLASSINSTDDIAFVAAGDIWRATLVNPTAASPIPGRGAVALHQNHPNPFNPSTAVEFEVFDVEARVELQLFDARGALVRRLVNERFLAGVHRVVWDGRNDVGKAAASGVYFCRLSTEEGAVARKMILAR